MLAGMRDMSVTEQRYQAVLDVIGEGRAVMEVASQWGVSQTPDRHHRFPQRQDTTTSISDPVTKPKSPCNVSGSRSTH